MVRIHFPPPASPFSRPCCTDRAGTPFLVAGIFVLVPGGPELLSRWSRGNLPGFVRVGVRLITRLLDDLERRYPHT